MSKNPLVVAEAASYLKNQQGLKKLDISAISVRTIILIKSLDNKDIDLGRGCNSRELAKYSFSEIAKSFLEDICLISIPKLKYILGNNLGYPSARSMLLDCETLDKIRDSVDVTKLSKDSLIANIRNRVIMEGEIDSYGYASISMRIVRRYTDKEAKESKKFWDFVAGNNEALFLELIAMDHNFLKLISSKLMKNAKLLSACIPKDPMSLGNCADFNNNKEVVLGSNKHNPGAVQFANPGLLQDKELLAETASQSLLTSQGAIDSTAQVGSPEGDGGKESVQFSGEF